MFAKIGISGFSDLLDFATTPIRSRLGKFADGVIAEGCGKVSIIMESPEGVAVEKSVCTGKPDACRSSALGLIEEGHRIVLEGLPLENVAALCCRHNYRWRQCHQVRSRNTLRFIIEPGRSSNADAKEV